MSSLARHVFLLGMIVAGTASAQDTVDAGETETDQSPQKVLVLRLSDDEKYMVDQVQAEFIIEELDTAEEAGYDMVILKIDTYGGVVMSAREINERLLRLKIPSIAYVETKAISAGAFVAYACQRIVMEADTTIGDAQMIQPTLEGDVKEAAEKFVTVYRSDWKKAADKNGHSYAIAQGFFDAEVEVLQVKGADGPTFILREDYDLLPEDARPEIIKIIVKKDKLLTLYAAEAEELGLVTVFPDFETFLASINVRQESISEVDMSTRQKILRLLGVNGWVFFVLTIIGLNGIYMEIKTPGFGVGGLTALVCFALVFGSRYLLGTASSLEIAIFVLGILLALAEIFVIPGFGVAGISGIVLMLGALLLASMPELDTLPPTDLKWDWMRSLGGMVAASFMVSLLSLLVTVPLFLKLPFVARRMLPQEMRADEGFVMNTVSQYEGLAGTEGVTEGVLRPSGKMVLSDGRIVDVVSEGPYVEEGQRVKVVVVDGNRIVVRPIQEATV